MFIQNNEFNKFTFWFKLITYIVPNLVNQIKLSVGSKNQYFTEIRVKYRLDIEFLIWNDPESGIKISDSKNVIWDTSGIVTPLSINIMKNYKHIFHAFTLIQKILLWWETGWYHESWLERYAN